MGVSLYRKYRPQTFGDVVGQEGAVSILEHAVANNAIGHAYLLSGPRGCGKTTIARILAKALNCIALKGAEPCGECANCRAITNGESMDVVEIDGASNNSVDEVRELKSHVALSPFSSKYKIYIIDEVHMLSAGAFNALLKTLEEPPTHVVFIMATTEPQKVPVTVRSRCQHIPFHSIGARQIANHLMRICELENVTATPEALWEIARQADGALRDALSMLEQVINRAKGDIKLNDVEAALGSGSRPALERWMSGLRQNLGASYAVLKSMMQEGASSQRIFEELFTLIKNMWLAACWPDAIKELDISEQEQKFLTDESQHWDSQDLRAILTALVGLISQARLGVRSDVLLGIFMLELTRIINHEPAPALISDARFSPPEPVHMQSQTVSGQNFFSTENFTPVPRETSTSLPYSKSESKPETPRTQTLKDNAEWNNTGVVEVTSPNSTESADENWVSVAAEKQIELSSAVEESDFVLRCGLIGADFFCAEQKLLLEVKHRYCFEALLARASLGWEKLGEFYPDGVFLRFQGRTIAVAGAEKSQNNQDSSGQFVMDLGTQRLTKSSNSSSPSFASSSTTAPSSGPTPFGDIVNDLTSLTKGELILVRYERDFNETASNSDLGGEDEKMDDTDTDDSE